MQLVAVALITTPLLFLGVVLFLRARGTMPEATTSILTPISGALGLSALVTGVVFSRLLAAVMLAWLLYTYARAPLRSG